MSMSQAKVNSVEELFEKINNENLKEKYLMNDFVFKKTNESKTFDLIYKGEYIEQVDFDNRSVEKVESRIGSIPHIYNTEMERY